MKRIYTFVAGIAAGSILISAAAAGISDVRVPENASLVIHADGKALLGRDGFSGLLGAALSGSSGSLDALLQEAKLTSADLENDYLFFLRPGENYAAGIIVRSENGKARKLYNAVIDWLEKNKARLIDKTPGGTRIVDFYLGGSRGMCILYNDNEALFCENYAGSNTFQELRTVDAVELEAFLQTHFPGMAFSAITARMPELYAQWQRSRSVRQLKMLHLCIQLYLDERSNVYFQSIDDFKSVMQPGGELFVAPFDRTEGRSSKTWESVSYAYVAGGVDSGMLSLPAAVPVLFEKPDRVPDDRIAILFADGSIGYRTKPTGGSCAAVVAMLRNEEAAPAAVWEKLAAAAAKLDPK